MQTTKAQSGASAATERTVPISLLEADPDNIRLAYESDVIDQLCQAVTEDGEFLQPPRVYRTAEGKLRSLNGSTRILSALKAHREGALTELTVIETSPPKSRAEKILFQLAENETRAQLGPLDRGRAFRMLRDEGMSYREILSECERKGIIPRGRTKGWISQLISLTELQADVQRMVNRGEFSINHALLIRKVPVERQLAVATRVASENLSIAELESIVAAENARLDGRVVEVVYNDLRQIVQQRADDAPRRGSKRAARPDTDHRNGPVFTSWTLLPARTKDCQRGGGLDALESLPAMESATPQVRQLALEALQAGHAPRRAIELAANAVLESEGASEAIRQLLTALATVMAAEELPNAGGPAVREYLRMRLQAVLDAINPGAPSTRASV